MSEENKGSATTEDSAAEPNSRRKFLKGGLAAAAGVAAGLRTTRLVASGLCAAAAPVARGVGAPARLVAGGLAD